MRGSALAYPVIYNVAYSYTAFQQGQGDNSFPGTQLDNDLAGLRGSIYNWVVFAEGVMRSDGALQNGIVTHDSLAPAVQTQIDTALATAVEAEAATDVLEVAVSDLATSTQNSIASLATSTQNSIASLNSFTRSVIQSPGVLQPLIVTKGNLSNALQSQFAGLPGSGNGTYNYAQNETGAVASPLIRRLNNTLFASEFGAQGDDVGGLGATNDRGALQLFLTALGVSGKEGRLDAGRSYFVSGGDLVLSPPANGQTNNIALYGYGARIRPDPTQSRTGLIIRRNTATRADEARIMLVEGLVIDMLNNGNALCGINVDGCPRTIVQHNTILVGSDSAADPFAGNTAIRVGQSNATNFNTGAILSTISGNNVHGAGKKGPIGVSVEGQCNGTRIIGNKLDGVDTALNIQLSNGTVVAGDDFANSLLFAENALEDYNIGVYVHSPALSPATIQWLDVCRNRSETCGTAFFYYVAQADSLNPPRLGPNAIADWTKYATVGAGLTVNVQDEFVSNVTFDPASLAAGATRAETTHTVVMQHATVGDSVEVSAPDLSGLIATGYVSDVNTVTIRLINPTSAAINQGSTKFNVRVRPSY